MSTQHLASIAVGLPGNEVEEVHHEELMYFNADHGEQNLVGYVVLTSGADSYTEIDFDILQEGIEESKKAFTKLTGLEAKVYVTVDSF